MPIFLAFRKGAVYARAMATEHAALIEAIGPKLIRDTYQLSRQNLHNWRKNGIPHKKRVAVARLAALSGVSLPADFFEGMDA